MKRRIFLKNFLKTMPALALFPQLLTSCKDKEDVAPITTSKKIVILGAGVAGLAAAKYFKDRNVAVTVIEAQDKVGGRLRTDRSQNIAFDEGASWIHGPTGNPITNLVTPSGMNTFLTSNNSLSIFDTNGVAYTDAVADAAYTDYRAAVNNIRTNGNLNQSFQQVFNTLYPSKINDRLWKYMLSAYTEFDSGGDVSNMSSLDFDDDEKFSGADLIITNGYDKLAQYLAQGIDIRLNQRVTNIEYAGTQINITAGANSYQADYLIVTVPLGVLKQNIISFSPALPTTKTGAISRMQMGNVNKFLLIFPSTFWDNTLQYIGYTPNTKGQYNYFLNINKFSPNANALMAFAFGNYATTTEGLTDAQLTAEIMTSLRAIYPTAPNPTTLLRTKWGSNINSYGAYSFATNNTRSTDFDILAQSVNNKIFFAGEHTSKTYRGTVHGAYLSGTREATAIAALL
ncbi:MAG: amine oxidase [Bacteroidetes bacterium]|nr:MAG: amine oxidase [Bacteroidota bacterium]TAG89133.1 MAG: amine oxidase [Bacteroidota bacterium]